MKKTRLLILVAFAGLALSACNGASLPVSTQYTEEELADLGGTIETPWVDYILPATDVSFPEEDMVVNLNKDDTYTYHPTISPKSATIEALTFTSGNLNVATVANGVLTAVGGGSTTIVVSSKENAFDPIELMVNVTVPLTDFIVNKDALDLGYGYTEQLSVTYVPADTTQEGITYTSDNPTIATVSEDGLVTAGNEDGTTKIKVTSSYINTIKEVTVVVEDKVIHAQSVVIANKQATLALDKSFALNAKVEPDNAENKGIDYVSSNEEVAVVDAAGNVSALAVGTTTITAKSQEIETVKDEFELNVYAITADTIDVPAEINLIVNNTEQLRPVFKHGGEVVTPSRSKLEYKSDDASIATVTSAGLITAKAEGTTQITASDAFANAPLDLEAVITVNVKKDVVTYNITGFADWTPKYGSEVFAWAWGGDAGYPGAWYHLTLSYEGDADDAYNVTGTFIAPRNIEGFVLVRCAFGTVTPDWEVVGDEEGRIYNKTSDVSVIGTSFVAPEWEDYPEEPTLEGYGIKFSDGVSVVGEDAGTDAQGRQQYEMKSVHFAEGAKFSIYDFGNKAGWVEAVEGYSFGGESAESENWKSYLELGENEYTVIAEFTADIFLKISYGNNSVYFGLVEEPVVGNSYAVKIGDVTTNMVEKDPTGTETKLFVANNVDVTADQSVTFYADLVAIKANIGPDQDDTEVVGSEKYNNYKGSVESMLLIQADAAKANIYLRIYADGMSFWIDGGNSIDHALDIADEGYGLLFSDGTSVVGNDNGEKVYDEVTYHEYMVADYFFASGAEFKLFDFANKAGWVDDVDGWSFGGDSKESEAWKDYLTKGSEYYAVKQDFYADVYLKLNVGGNIIYFGLKDAPLPVTDEYNFKLGATSYELDEQDLTPAEIEDEKIGKYTTTLDVLAGTEFSFLAEETTIRNNIGANPDDIKEAPEVSLYNNYIDGDNGIYTIQADQDDAYIELNVYRDGYSFWISGGNSADHVRPEDYYLIGGFNSWTTEDDAYKLAKVTVDHYQITDVDFDAEDTLKVYWPNGETEVDKYIANASTWDECGFTLDEDGNLVVTEAGRYTVDLWFNDESYETNNHVTLTKQVIFADVYSMKINNVDVGLEKSVEDLAENEEMKFVKAGVAVVAGQSIEMFADAVAITEHLGPNPDDIKEPPEVSLYNNYNGSLLGGYEIQASGTVDVEMHIWKDGGVSFWISGGDSDDHTLPADYFLIGGFNGWTTEDVNYKLTKVTANQYQITGIEFVAGDTLKVFWPDGETEVEKYFSDASIWDECGFTLDGDGNVVVSVEGTYTVDFYVTADYDNHIVLTRTGDLTTLHLSAYSANVTVGGAAAVVTASHVTGTLVAESDDTDVATVSVDGNNITITAEAKGTATITVGDDGVVERTIEVTVAGTKTISVSLGAWTGDSAVIYAWVWGEGVTAQWIQVDLANNRIIVPEGVTGLKLVRMNPAGLELVNKYSFDGLTGTKWNQSGDLVYTADKVLTFDQWDVEGYSTFTWETPAP